MKIVDDMTPEQQAEQELLEAKAREVAHMIDRACNPEMRHPRDFENRRTGFALLLFSFGDPPQPATYLSNGPRGDMIRAIEEWLQRAKARQ